MLGVLLYSFPSHAYLNGEEGWPWYVFGQQRKGTAVDSGADSEQKDRSPLKLLVIIVAIIWNQCPVHLQPCILCLIIMHLRIYLL